MCYSSTLRKSGATTCTRIHIIQSVGIHDMSEHINSDYSDRISPSSTQAGFCIYILIDG
jgi:hypothetical protein